MIYLIYLLIITTHQGDDQKTDHNMLKTVGVRGVRSCRWNSSSPRTILGGVSEVKDFGKVIRDYSVLGKVKLTGLVAFTASAGFAAAGGPIVSVAHAALFTGTFLQSMSANTFNQVAERDFDKLMKRTNRRPIVTGDVTPEEARRTATAQVTTGTVMLYAVDPMAAALGVACWGLYVHGYTPMKREHWLNTWVGAVVGAIPPVMGCAAAGASIMSPTSIFLASLLYLWQIPHFLSLCYLNRRDYQAAGFKMLSHIDTKKAGIFSLRYSCYMTAATTVMPLYFGIASPLFAMEAAAMGSFMTYASYEFMQVCYDC